MSEKDILIEKNNLVNSDEWKRIRDLQLDRIVTLSTGNTDPLIIVGMLRSIANTDKWREDFINRKGKENKE
jgi:hypothetical protein